MATAKKRVAVKKPTKTIVYKLTKPAVKGVYLTRSEPPMKFSIGKLAKVRKGFSLDCYTSIQQALKNHPDHIGTGIWAVLKCETLDIPVGGYGRAEVFSLTPVKDLGTFNSNPGQTNLRGFYDDKGLTDGEFSKKFKTRRRS